MNLTPVPTHITCDNCNEQFVIKELITDKKWIVRCKLCSKDVCPACRSEEFANHHKECKE